MPRGAVQFRLLIKIILVFGSFELSSVWANAIGIYPWPDASPFDVFGQIRLVVGESRERLWLEALLVLLGCGTG